MHIFPKQNSAVNSQILCAVTTFKALLPEHTRVKAHTGLLQGIGCIMLYMHVLEIHCTHGPPNKRLLTNELT